jgi:hypothetical protein
MRVTKHLSNLESKRLAKEQRKAFRVKLWSDLTIAYTQAANSTDSKKAVLWADNVLADFDDRFGINLMD